ncbi:MAG: PrsW family intramembrane metalloprotease [Gammaproteobacteria bacterium]|nr:PrsW family intramembrane metalloprotease [Gammaproteobacteria bacterium]
MLFLPILVPVAFWAIYHYHKDRHRPEPLGNLLLCFLLGIGASFISQAMYQAAGIIGIRYDAFMLADSSLAGLFAYAVLVIGGIEETAKFIPFVVVALRLKAFDEKMDGIIYASFIALGYAAAENYSYLEFLDDRDAVLRGFASPLVHIMFSSTWGYMVGKAYLAGRPLVLLSYLAVTVSALLHGLYDFVVLAFPEALPVSALLILSIWLWRMRVITRLQAQHHATQRE